MAGCLRFVLRIVDQDESGQASPTAHGPAQPLHDLIACQAPLVEHISGGTVGAFPGAVLDPYHHAVSFNWNELLENPEGIESSALERVIGIGQGRVVQGVSVELHSLEIRELGSFGLMRTDIAAESTHPEHLLTG